MAVPKTAALPLGYAPSRRCERAPIRAAPDWQGAAWAAIRLKPRDPAVRIGGAAALDVDEPVLEHRRHLPRPASADGEAGVAARSEEHTSELQSLMRISYAVFCLKKKN